MAFVATPAQLEAFKKRCSEPSYAQEAIAVEFTTTHGFIRSVLLPTFGPDTEAIGLISVSSWQSNVCGDFELSCVAVRCKCDGQSGYFNLQLVVTDAFAATWSRETWGEVKKEGKVRLLSNRNRMLGYMERSGVRLIEIDAEITETLEPDTQ